MNESAGILRATTWNALKLALGRAAEGRRHRPDVARFLMDAEPRLLALQRALRLRWPAEGAWSPTPGRLRHIRDPKPRTITVIPFEDRVAHHALMAEVEPALERLAVHHSYACRPGRGQHQALRQVRRWARRHPWCLRLDVRQFFASIPRDRLVRRIHRVVPDRGLAHALARIVRAPSPGLPPDRGIPVGSLTSQHLANAYLAPLDHELADHRGFVALRYMDDLAVFGEHDALLALRRDLDVWLPEHLGLHWHVEVCQLHRCDRGIPWLGWTIDPLRIRPRSRSWRRWAAKIRAVLADPDLDEDVRQASLVSSLAHLLPFDTWPPRPETHPEGGAGASCASRWRHPPRGVDRIARTCGGRDVG